MRGERRRAVSVCGASEVINSDPRCHLSSSRVIASHDNNPMTTTDLWRQTWYYMTLRVYVMYRWITWIILEESFLWYFQFLWFVLSTSNQVFDMCHMPHGSWWHQNYDSDQKIIIGTKIFNCESSSSTIYQINLFVCLSVCVQSWNLSFEGSPANQSTVWDLLTNHRTVF